jgi:hypothetical protein
MAYFLDEKKMINGNIQQHEQRLNSQYTRFLEKTPSFATYYQINNVESTADTGLQQTERYIGENSPLRFHCLREFPLYGIDDIVLDLNNDNEYGMDSTYDGEAVILPHTIHPKPDDFFTIAYIGKNYVFRVTSVSYDTIKSNNYYKIGYTLYSIDDTDVKSLNKQSTEFSTVIFTNIGTQEKFLIRDDEITTLSEINQVYQQIADLYKVYFYSRIYNSFLFQEQDPFYTWHDPFLHHFINNYGLFNQKNNYETLFLHIENMDGIFMSKYHMSIYRALELGRRDMVKDDLFSRMTISSNTSIFARYGNEQIKKIDVGGGEESYLGSDLIDRILNNSISVDSNIVDETIVKYFNHGIQTISDISVKALKEYPTFVNLTRESYQRVPILLYIIKDVYHKFMSVN